MSLTRNDSIFKFRLGGLLSTSLISNSKSKCQELKKIQTVIFHISNGGFVLVMYSWTFTHYFQ